MKHIERILLKVVHRVAQVVPLRVVDVDYVLAGSNRQLFLVRAVIVVAVDFNHFVRRIDHFIERHPVLNLRIVKHIERILLKVVHRVAQIVPLRIVEVDHVLAGSNRQRFLIRAGVVVAVDPNHFVLRLDHIIERHLALNLLFVKHIGRALLKVVHLIAQVGLLLIIDLNNVLAFIRSNRQRAVLRLFELIPIFRLESESVFIDLTSVQRAAGIGSGRVYFAVVVMLDLILVGVRRIVHIDNRVFATYELLHGIMSIRIGVAGYIFNIFFF